MKRTNFRLRLCMTLLLLNLLFIWGNSLMPGELSSRFSQWISSVLFGDKIQEIPDIDGMHLLRKLAHFSEFAALGGILYWLFCMYSQHKWLQFLLPLAVGTGVACVDETIQLFVDGRYGCITDVCIDAAGVFTGIVLIYLAHKILMKKRLKRN